MITEALRSDTIWKLVVQINLQVTTNQLDKALLPAGLNFIKNNKLTPELAEILAFFPHYLLKYTTIRGHFISPSAGLLFPQPSLHDNYLHCN